MSDFRSGDVLGYLPTEPHCKEGIAYVREDGRAVDTYWRPTGEGQSHLLSDVEMTTAGVMFNVEDFDPLDRYSAVSRQTWLTYHPRDRQRITSQHGLQELLFVRKGATPDLATQIDNARCKVEIAESKLSGAQRALEHAREDLAGLEATREAVST